MESKCSRSPKSAVIQMASEDSGVSEAIVGSVYKALEKQVNQMVLNGHSVYWPGIGYISLGIHAKAVKNKDNVSANLIRTVRLRLRLADELKEELKDTALEVDYIDDGEA